MSKYFAIERSPSLLMHHFLHWARLAESWNGNRLPTQSSLVTDVTHGTSFLASGSIRRCCVLFSVDSVITNIGERLLAGKNGDDA
jgi:hypothetical protein